MAITVRTERFPDGRSATIACICVGCMEDRPIDHLICPLCKRMVPVIHAAATREGRAAVRAIIARLETDKPYRDAQVDHYTQRPNGTWGRGDILEETDYGVVEISVDVPVVF